MYSKVRVFLSVPLAAALLSCGGGGGGDITPPPPPPVVDLNAVAAVTVSAPSTTLAATRTLLLTAQATNSAGTVLTGQAFVWSTSDPTKATVEQNGTVTGVSAGSVIVAAAIGTKNGQVTLTITPAPVAVSIAVNAGNGQTATVNSAVPQPPSVIARDAAGGPVAGVAVTFAVTQGNGTVSGPSQVTNTAGIATVGGWVMGPTPGPQALTATSGTLSGSPVTFTATAVALPSNMRQYNVTSNNPCGNVQLRTGEVKAETAHLTIVADISNPSGGFTDADYAAFGSTFESLVWPVLTQNFGVPFDIDGGGKVVAFFTSAVNQLTPAGSTSFVGGFFFARDLFPKISSTPNQNCPGSNEAEMFYVLAPDPSGSLGLAHSTSFVRNMAIAVIGHEMQHLINASRRMYGTTGATAFERVWMEEGLSHIAEEMLFYEASGRAPRSNLGLPELSGATQPFTSSYMQQNLSRFSLYLKDPSNYAPYTADDDLQIRGAAWSMLRYLADRGSVSTVTGQACNMTAPIALAVNASCRIEGGDAQQFSVDGSGGSEYTLVAFADGIPLPISVSATLALNPAGPPTPSQSPMGPSLSQLPGGRTLDMSFHNKLSGMTRRELTARIPQARAKFRRNSRGAARFSISAPTGASFSTALVEPVWGRLVNTADTGITNLRREFGSLVNLNIRDWAVANYVDDAVTVPAAYTHPSWNFRSAMQFLSTNNQYAIQTRLLTQVHNHTIVDGGAAYYRFGVAASATAGVAVTVNNAIPPSNLRMVLVRTK